MYNQIKKIQPICFENACWAYIVGAAIAIKKGCRKAADAAAAIGEGLQSFCIPGSVADTRKVGLGHGNLGKMILCSAVMGLGTSIGGYRIIKSVGMDMVKLKPYQGFSADLAATLCLLFSSLAGIPVSTTHTKTTAIMGVGAARRMGNVNWKIVKELVLTWVFTFPGCGLLGFIMAKLFLHMFA